MGILKVIGWILKLPLILLVLATVGLGFCAAYGLLPGFRIEYRYPIALASIVLLYIIGVLFTSRKKKDKQIERSSESIESVDQLDDETRQLLEEYMQ